MKRIALALTLLVLAAPAASAATPPKVTVSPTAFVAAGLRTSLRLTVKGSHLASLRIRFGDGSRDLVTARVPEVRTFTVTHTYTKVGKTPSPPASPTPAGARRRPT